LKNRLAFCLFTLGLLALVICLAACGRTTTSGDGVINIPHDTDWGFSNCLVCHSDGDMAMPDNHVAYTTDQCSMCHVPATTTEPPTDTTEPPTDTTEPPTDTTEPPTDTTEPPSGPGPISASNHASQSNASMCNICHTGSSAILANPADHADYADDSCLDAGCHELP